mmetsp:Transcript_60846/g.101112  ORF Transcript_60846/g.101112 Transcript_60846/m.101112 type:complete len:286 (+) Transcript_60846:73-930(+)
MPPAPPDSPGQVTHRNIVAARRAFHEQDEASARKLSQEAHSIRGRSSWNEKGHSDELTNCGMTLMLRGAVEGIILGLSFLSLADGAKWPQALCQGAASAMVACWAMLSAAREGLECQTYRAHYTHERRREQWELEHFPEGEVAEMVELYVQRGLPHKEARQVVHDMAKIPEFFVDVMMMEELHMPPPSSLAPNEAALRSGCSSLISGGLMAFSHLLIGLCCSPPMSSVLLGMVACTALALLGFVRASRTHQGKRRLALQTASLALPCTLFGRFAGVLLAHCVTVK